MNMEQLSSKEAIVLSGTRFWVNLTTRQIAEFQLGQELLCMPLEVYQNALSVELGRPVYTHELYNPGKLREELYNRHAASSLDEVVAELLSMIRHNK